MVSLTNGLMTEYVTGCYHDVIIKSIVGRYRYVIEIN